MSTEIINQTGWSLPHPDVFIGLNIPTARIRASMGLFLNH